MAGVGHGCLLVHIYLDGVIRSQSPSQSYSCHLCPLGGGMDALLKLISMLLPQASKQPEQSLLTQPSWHRRHQHL